MVLFTTSFQRVFKSIVSRAGTFLPVMLCDDNPVWEAPLWGALEHAVNKKEHEISLHAVYEHRLRNATSRSDLWMLYITKRSHSGYFIEPEGSLPYSKVPATCPYPEPAWSSPSPHIPHPEDPSQYYFSFMPASSKWSLSFRFPHQNPVYSLLSPICATWPAHLIFLDLIT